MTTRHFVDRLLKPRLRDAPLEVDWKEAIVTSGNHVYWNRGPRLESAGLSEDDIGFRALVGAAVTAPTSTRRRTSAQPPPAPRSTRCSPTTPRPSRPKPESSR
jgi:hypothetical protein